MLGKKGEGAHNKKLGIRGLGYGGWEQLPGKQLSHFH